MGVARKGLERKPLILLYSPTLRLAEATWPRTDQGKILRVLLRWCAVWAVQSLRNLADWSWHIIVEDCCVSGSRLLVALLIIVDQ